MEKYPKFIIKDGNLILMKVQFHHEIAQLTESDVQNQKHKQYDIKGGGWFRYIPDLKKFILYGKSYSFGAARFEDIKACIEAGRVYSNYMLTHSIAEGNRFEYMTESHEILEIK